MKGVIFNAVEEAVTHLYSEDVWDDLLDAAGLDGHYTSLGTYEDGELLALVVAGCEATGLDANDLVRALGEHAFPHLVQRHPELVVADNTFDFLHSVNDIIHPEVLKLHPDAKPPEFEFDRRSDKVLRMTYKSDRKLGVMAEGLIHGAAAHFGERVEISVVSGAGESETTFDIELGANEDVRAA